MYKLVSLTRKSGALIYSCFECGHLDFCNGFSVAWPACASQDLGAPKNMSRGICGQGLLRLVRGEDGVDSNLCVSQLRNPEVT